MATITLTLAPEIEAKIDRILQILESGKAPTYAGMAFDVESGQAEPLMATETNEAMPWDDNTSKVEDAPQAEPARVEHTKEEVQQLVVRLAAAGKKIQVREIVTAYADKVSAIPAEKYGEVIAKLKAVEQ